MESRKPAFDTDCLGTACNTTAAHGWRLGDEARPVSWMEAQNLLIAAEQAGGLRVPPDQRNKFLIAIMIAFDQGLMVGHVYAQQNGIPDA